MTPVALHPNLPMIYRRKVEEMEAELADPELGAGGHGGHSHDPAFPG